jgi:hypothetical protein
MSLGPNVPRTDDVLSATMCHGLEDELPADGGGAQRVKVTVGEHG